MTKWGRESPERGASARSRGRTGISRPLPAVTPAPAPVSLAQFDKMAKTPAVGKKAAKTPKKAGKSTKRTKRVESYRYAAFRARGKRQRDGLARPPT